MPIHDADDLSALISDPTENLLKESKGSSWGPINTGVQKGKRMSLGDIYQPVDWIIFALNKSLFIPARHLVPLKFKH